VLGGLSRSSERFGRSGELAHLVMYLPHSDQYSAAVEEDYAKRLNKLAKYSLGRDEIGDLAASLQNVLIETAQQASYHQALSTELRQSVEQPTAEFGVRLGNLKKGLQGSVEKSYRNKGLQEGHVLKVSLRLA